MSPSAVVLATLLHGAVVVAWWWASPLGAYDQTENAIEVTVESPAPRESPQVAAVQAPPAPPASPPPSAPTRPTAQPRLGLPPIGGSPEATKPAQTQPPVQAQPQPPPPPDPQQALAPQTPPPPEPPPPVLEQVLPPIASPPAPLTSRDIPKPPPAPPPPKPRPPQQPAQQQPPPQQQALKPSPLRPTAPPGPQTAAPSPGPSVTFQNPADAYKSNRVKDEYLWRVAARISQYHVPAPNLLGQGALVVRLVIARDGRLLDSGIRQSSGVPAIDKGAIEAARAASPYAPLPWEIAGAAVEFILPLNFAHRQR